MRLMNSKNPYMMRLKTFARNSANGLSNLLSYRRNMNKSKIDARDTGEAVKDMAVELRMVRNEVEESKIDVELMKIKQVITLLQDSRVIQSIINKRKEQNGNSK